MASVSHDRLFEAFEEICDLEATQQHRALEDLHNDDPDLAREVRALLSADAEADDGPDLMAHVQAQAAEAMRVVTHPRIEELRSARPDAPQNLAHYEVLEPIGEGGMGVVFRARDTERGRLVALKTLFRVDPAALAQLKREFRVAADLSHPNLVTLHELVEDDDVWFFTMGYVDGVDFLSHVLEDPTRLRPALRQLGSGVRALHAAGLLHLDLKPANVLVDARGRVVILDFGLTVPVAHPNRTEIAGTPAYMAPEQAQGHALSSSTDWYAVGVMLYRALTGRLPLEGSNVLAAKRTEDFEDPGRLAPDAPPDLLDLCRALLRRDPSARPPDAAILDALGVDDEAQSPTAVFVGRQAQLEALHGAYERARVQTVLATVAGVSGMGKSMLLERFTTRLRATEDPPAVLTGRCHERESTPFKAFDSLVESLAAHLAQESLAFDSPDLVRGAAALARLFPALAAVVPGAGTAAVPSASESRRRALAAFKALLRELAARHPTVVVIDDLQWGDSDSAHLLAELLAPPDPPTMLVVVSTRVGAVDPDSALGELLASDLGEQVERATIDVDALSPGDTRTLVRQLAERSGRPGPSLEVVDQVATLSAGVPFFIETLLERAQAGMPLVSVEAVLADRIAQLQPEDASLVGVLAIAGQPLAQTEAFEAAGIEADEYEVVARLRRARWVTSHGGRPRDPLELVHGRVRDAVEQTLPPARQQSIHGRLLEVLEPRGASAETLARHGIGSGRPDIAAGYAVVAARDAAEALAFERAAELYERALRWAPPADPDEARALAVARAQALADAGRSVDAGRALEAASTSARGEESRALRRRAAEQYFLGGRADDHGLRLAGDVLRELGLRIPRTRLASLTSALRNAARIWWRSRFGRDAAPRPLDGERMDTLLGVARGISLTENPAALALFTEHFRIAQRNGDPRHLAPSLSHAAVSLSFVPIRGFAHKGERALERAEAMLGSVNDDRITAMVTAQRGIFETLHGRWASGSERLAEALERLHAKCPGAIWETLLARMFLLTAEVERGQYDEAHALASRWSVRQRELGNRYGIYVGATFTALSALATGRPEEFEVARAEARPLLEDEDGRSLMVQHANAVRVELWKALCDGEYGDGWVVAQEHWPIIVRSGLLHLPGARVLGLGPFGTIALAAASRVQGRERRRRLSVARRHARRLLREALPHAAPLGETLFAGLARLEGRSDEAAARYQRAADRFGAAGMPVAAAAVRLRLSVGRGESANEARDEMAVHGVADPDAFARVFAPEL